ncbi:MAG TPA: type II secretion system F family protein [Thermoanaerobaculia bacterium]|nr:type II secretion system F family protein [Thermoanaerobaculia bacterium]
MEYVCHVGTGEGRVLRQVRRAPDERALRAELEREGLELLGLERRLAAVPRRPSFGRRRVPLQVLLLFSQELGALLRAGLPLLQSLGMLVSRQRHALFKSLLEQVYDRVKSGAELSEAFAEFGDSFPSLYPSALKAGERTGDLEQVLQRVVRYFRLVLDAKRRVYTALVYPAVLLGLSITMLGIMAIYVVPRFRVFYEAMELEELPLLTRLTLGTATALRDRLPLVVLALALASPFIGRWMRSGPGQLALARFRLGIPVLGSVFHRFAVSEFCRSLSTLLAGGLPLVQSLEISIRAVGNAWIRERLLPTIDRVREGRSLASALGDTGQVPPIVLDMVEVGETTGSLDQMLASVSDFLDEEVETQMQRLLALLEPILLVFVGGLVAILLVSVYLPIFSALSRIQ